MVRPLVPAFVDFSEEFTQGVESLTSAKAKRLDFAASCLSADGISVHHASYYHAFSSFSGAPVQELQVSRKRIVNSFCDAGLHRQLLEIKRLRSSIFSVVPRLIK